MGPVVMPWISIELFAPAFITAGVRPSLPVLAKAQKPPTEIQGMTTGPIVPEPGGIAVLLSGMAGMFGYVIKTRRK
jgi:hypothetical protein